MTRTKRAPSHKAPQTGKKRRPAKRIAPYHHGSLREAMLRAAESILERDGIRGLTLRAAAREAGVSPLHGWKQSAAAMSPSRGNIPIFFC